MAGVNVSVLPALRHDPGTAGCSTGRGEPAESGADRSTRIGAAPSVPCTAPPWATARTRSGTAGAAGGRWLAPDPVAVVWPARAVPSVPAATPPTASTATTAVASSTILALGGPPVPSGRPLPPRPAAASAPRTHAGVCNVPLPVSLGPAGSCRHNERIFPLPGSARTGSMPLLAGTGHSARKSWRLRSEPLFTAEDGVQPHRQRGDDERGRPEPRDPAESGVGHVLPVEAGHRGRHGDDRGPAGHLLRDHVQPVAAHREVRLQDGADQVAQ